ncbi:MAG: NAD(P)/FAD-dependent oxidoreductase [Planctomycetota bacterium]|nr:NAD(P)/FAD-dependent oxidoreductase [Planctomycetota bacterium]
MTHEADIVVVGCGAAGLFASIFAGRTLRAAGSSARVLGVDGAKALGAKILVAGGGRCNVTHHAVDETAYAGSTPNAIRKVLRRFDVPQTRAFFAELGVELKREETGKLFPTTDDAHTVLNALKRAADDAGVRLVHPWRVSSITRAADGFVVTRDAGATADAGTETITARRVILATGGKSLPKSGSDGIGHVLARSLGHSITPRVFPALVPLTLAEGSFIRAFSGLTLPTTIELRSAGGKRLRSFTNSMLCTHFGLSGPGVLDISRYWLDARADATEKGEPEPLLIINWLPAHTLESLEALLVERARKPQAPSPGRVLSELMPERLARQLCLEAGVEFSQSLSVLTREQRRAICLSVTQTRVPATGDRGYLFAEVTAGGVPLAEVNLDTMESRVCPGLHLCGELCDVDGRIGGFNFQWAWASGHAAGCGAGNAIAHAASNKNASAHTEA